MWTKTGKYQPVLITSGEQDMNKKLISIVSAILFSASAGQAQALDGEALFKNPQKGGCTACHGKDAKSPIMNQYPKLAGQNEAYLLQP